jgi:hypothetical protein
MTQRRKSDETYRLSIIPGGAPTDTRLEPRDLQVLCLLGRHTQRNGWCRRSQVRMAEELHVGRATIYRSLKRLVDAGYVEQRAEGRAGIDPPQKGEQPFASYAYRVLLDREMEEVDEGGAHERAGGVPMHDGHPVPTQDGHPVPISRAPLIEPTPLEQPPNKSARARAAGGGEERPPARKKYSDAFERFWAEIRKWPEFTTIWSKPSVWDAWQALGLAGELLEPGDMVAAAREYGRERTRLNAEAVKQRKTPQHTKHPANFLREKLFLGIHEALAERKASAGPPRRISIDAGHVERLRRAGISDDLIAAWFGDGEFDEGQPVIFRAATLVKADWIAQRFAAHLERAFGAPVIVTVKQERAA